MRAQSEPGAAKLAVLNAIADDHARTHTQLVHFLGVTPGWVSTNLRWLLENEYIAISGSIRPPGAVRGMKTYVVTEDGREALASGFGAAPLQTSKRRMDDKFQRLRERVAELEQRVAALGRAA